MVSASFCGLLCFSFSPLFGSLLWGPRRAPGGPKAWSGRWTRSFFSIHPTKRGRRGSISLSGKSPLSELGHRRLGSLQGSDLSGPGKKGAPPFLGPKTRLLHAASRLPFSSSFCLLLGLIPSLEPEKRKEKEPLQGSPHCRLLEALGFSRRSRSFFRLILRFSWPKENRAEPASLSPQAISTEFLALSVSGLEKKTGALSAGIRTCAAGKGLSGRAAASGAARR